MNCSLPGQHTEDQEHLMQEWHTCWDFEQVCFVAELNHYEAVNFERRFDLAL
jgi:hypothetical protein